MSILLVYEVDKILKFCLKHQMQPNTFNRTIIEHREEVRAGNNLMTKQDYLLDKSISLNVHKILSIHEKNIKNIFLIIRIIILLILNHDTMYL